MQYNFLFRWIFGIYIYFIFALQDNYVLYIMIMDLIILPGISVTSRVLPVLADTQLVRARAIHRWWNIDGNGQAGNLRAVWYVRHQVPGSYPNTSIGLLVRVDYVELVIVGIYQLLYIYLQVLAIELDFVLVRVSRNLSTLNNRYFAT